MVFFLVHSLGTINMNLIGDKPTIPKMYDFLHNKAGAGLRLS